MHRIRWGCIRPLSTLAGGWCNSKFNSALFWIACTPHGSQVQNFLMLQLNSALKYVFWKHSREEKGNAVTESFHIWSAISTVYSKFREPAELCWVDFICITVCSVNSGIVTSQSTHHVASIMHHVAGFPARHRKWLGDMTSINTPSVSAPQHSRSALWGCV